MAVDVISPDARKKVDELFLYWLSEPSTQELLRHEVAKVCGLQQQRLDLLSPPLMPRPASPTARAITPPPPAPTPAAATSLSPSRASPKLSRSASGYSAAHKQQQQQVKPLVNGFVEETDGVESLPVKTSAEPTSVQLKIPALVLPTESAESIPRFYFPNGEPRKEEERHIEKVMVAVGRIFEKYPRQEVPRKDFHLIVKALKLPFYWKMPLFKAVAGKSKKYATLSSFKKTWLKITSVCHDEPSRFISLLSYADPNRNYLVSQDFELLIQDIVECHPGLEFLRAAPEFHQRYVETVIGRIFYSVDKTWRRRIYAQDLRNSDFLECLSQLEHEDDINKFTHFFSYEHFYVIYCKFWELDSDHDLLIDRNDLMRHADHSLTSRVVDRLLSGVVTHDSEAPLGKMSYKDFVWFLISEEDKTSTRSIEYWFRILDKDGDGVISLYELEYFYEEILSRLEEMNIESLSVRDTICHILDMVNPRQPNVITLKDLKNCQLASQFFNTFINLEKYMDYEQREAVTLNQEDADDDHILTDWEKYASEQYELLVAEELYDDEDLMDGDVIDSENES